MAGAEQPKKPGLVQELAADGSVVQPAQLKPEGADAPGPAAQAQADGRAVSTGKPLIKKGFLDKSGSSNPLLYPEGRSDQGCGEGVLANLSSRDHSL